MKPVSDQPPLPLPPRQGDVPGVIRWAGDLTRQLFTYLRELSLRLNHAFTDDNEALSSVAGMTTTNADLLTKVSEGTWTPVLKGSAGDPTYTLSSYSPGTQWWTRIGSKVTIFFYFNVATFTGGNGNLAITGLPFSVKTNNSSGVLSYFNLTGTLPANFLGMQGCLAAPNFGGVSNCLRLIYSTTTGATGELQCSHFGPNAWMIGSISYQTDDA